MLRQLIAVLLLLGLPASAAAEAPALPRGDRLLGMAINEIAAEEFGASVARAKSAGVQTTSLDLNWDDIETAPGVFAPAVDFLSIAASYYPAEGIALELGIKPIDTVADRRPAWLRGKRWSDPQVINAYGRLLDWAMAKTGRLDIVAFAVGNEVDVLLADDARAWRDYRTFVRAAIDRLHRLRPGLQVGVKVTFDGLTGPNRNRAREVNEVTDLVLVTYYPLTVAFRARPPESPGADFAALTRLYPGRRIDFSEIGYPASPPCGSSKRTQAAFVRATFAAWDRQALQVRRLSFVFLNDISKAELDVFIRYYGVAEPCFGRYLATLGLRTNAGADKPAMRALAEEAHRRGW